MSNLIPICAEWKLTPEILPAEPGAYLIFAQLTMPVHLPQRFGKAVLLPGIYLYAGSAHGPGGIRARCSRHFRREKKLHWHVDWLTHRATSIQAAAFFDKSECDLVDEILRSGRGDCPIKGFGSSDCMHCMAHLIRLSIEYCSEVFAGDTGDSREMLLQ